LRRQHDLASGGCAGAGGDPTGRLPQGADGLAALVRETLRLDPLSGMVFVFRAKPADSGRNKTE
jgi:IS66 Orf2 like protein